VTVRADASRLIQVGWRAHVRDPGFRANAYVALNARASASLRARPRTTAVGARVRLSGRVRGIVPSRGVPVIFQGRAGSHGHWSTFAEGHADRHGRFGVRYRFRSASSHGRTFSFRVKLRGDARFPYSVGYSHSVRVRVR
jgi:hypothetical protein